jgi:hypothetical protein
MFFGNELTEASSKLSSYAFSSNRIEISKKYRRTMQFFVESTKKEMKISAFGIFDANMVRFRNVISVGRKLERLQINIKLQLLICFSLIYFLTILVLKHMPLLKRMNNEILSQNITIKT